MFLLAISYGAVDVFDLVQPRSQGVLGMMSVVFVPVFMCFEDLTCQCRGDAPETQSWTTARSQCLDHMHHSDTKSTRIHYKSKTRKMTNKNHKTHEV